ncbi:unnamed protein product, partial [Penicillium nalgiovense]
PILRGTLDDAEPVLRSTFLHRWARGSDSRSHGDSQARRQEGHHDTWECEDRSPDFFWAGNPAPFIIFQLRFHQGTNCADGSENHCLTVYSLRNPNCRTSRFGASRLTSFYSP